MTNILSIILGSLARGPETLQFPERVEPEARFRGAVTMNPERCIACGICHHVCVSNAIELRTFEDHAEWSYDPGACTFCSRCVAQCPVGALKQEGDRPATYETPGALRTRLKVTYPKCPECGEPALPYANSVLRRAFSGISDEIKERGHLCARCRRHRTQEALKESVLKGSMTTPEETEGNTDER